MNITDKVKYKPQIKIPMETHTITYTAKPLCGGWYAIYKNTIPIEKNSAGCYTSHPTRKTRERILTTRSPKKILLSLQKQLQAQTITSKNVSNLN